jgi:hypothetical protein
LSPLTSLSGSRSPNSEILLFVRMRVVRFGADKCKEGEMVDIRLLARRRVCSRLRRGKLLRATRELSVKSMASCWSYIRMMCSPMCGASEIMYAYLGYTKVFDCRDFVSWHGSWYRTTTRIFCRLTAKV